MAAHGVATALLFNHGLVEGFPAFLFPGVFSYFRGFGSGRGWIWSSAIDPEMIVRHVPRDLISSSLHSILSLLLLLPSI